MHVSSIRDLVEIKGRDNVGIFLYRKLIHAEGINLLQDCTVISEVSVVSEVRITEVAAGGSRRNCARK